MKTWAFLNLSAIYLKKYLSYGLETWSAIRLHDEILKNHLIFSEFWPFENLGILNLSERYLGNYLRQGLETWLADRG